MQGIRLSNHGGLPSVTPELGFRRTVALIHADRRIYVFAGDVRLVFDDSGAVVAFSSTGTMDRWTLSHDRVIA